MTDHKRQAINSLESSMTANTLEWGALCTQRAIAHALLAILEKLEAMTDIGVFVDGMPEHPEEEQPKE